MSSTELERTKRLWRSTPFAWGTADCIVSVCDHVLRVTGIDPAAPWRGSYDDEAGAGAIHEAHGGVLALFDHGMSLVGFQRGARAPGRPVVVEFMGKEMAGIDTGRRVMMRLDGRGVIEWPARVLGAWEI